jgi:FAD dependent oxidoreductase TIGR03364
MDLYANEPYRLQWLSADDVLNHSPGVKREGLLGGLFSKTEATVYSREAIRQIPAWLAATFGVEFVFGCAITSIEMPFVRALTEQWKVGHTFVCSGSDFETLYPEWYLNQGLTKCKLQMLKARPLRPIELGPSLCAGLTLRHYEAFQKCPTLPSVSDRYDQTNLLFKENGIHVLVSQNPMGDFIIGDSHHYGKTVEPFDQEVVDKIILDYLATFFHIETLEITERWNGVYPKYRGGIDLILRPEKDVTIVNGLGGAGMTLSFGLAEETIAAL